MRALAIACALGLGGCGHELDTTMRATSEPPPPPSDSLGRTHRPYAGKPRYLAAARPLAPTTSPAATGDKPSAALAADNPCRARSPACDTRLRAVLAALDAQILALAAPPAESELSALRRSLARLTPLLAAYPDFAAERDELAALVEKYATLSTVDQAAARRRMIELADLVRVQLAAAQ